MSRIFVVGSINTDLVIGAPYMPASGETLTGGGFFTAHGGKGANQAVAAARLGGDVVMCACVGDDAFGENAIKSLQADGVDTRFVRVCKNTPTGTAVIVVIDGDNRIILDKGANAQLCKADVDAALEEAQAGDILLAQLENPVDVVGYALEQGKKKGMTVILNPAPANVAAKEFVDCCDLVIPNETETEILGGKAELLQKTGGKLIITLGGKGYEITENGVSTTYPCIKVQAVDTTAAGDTLCGGLCARLASGDRLEKAAAFGSKAASIACTRKGAQPSVPTKAEVEAWN